MATWKSENSLLTQVGVEILNKVKAGIGSITVTRVVAGSGRVSASQLFQQTALSGTTKPMIITQTFIRDFGSEVSVYITNEDFTESFNLNQIGIFVTHPDYSGEQLYHISQCESEGVDVVPALGETPVTFGYSLFLEHGNSNSISITVDPQGMVTVQDFEKLKSITVSPNLLDNWYFLNPVVQWENSELFIKRWKKFYGTIELTEHGLVIQKANSPFGYAVLQSIITTNNHLLGKQVTISVLTTEGLFKSTGVIKDDPNTTVTTRYNTRDSYFRSHYAEGQLIGEFVSVNDTDLAIIAVKMELGSEQTLAHQDSDGNWVLNEIPNFAEEAAKCAQYDKTSGEYLGAIPCTLVYGRSDISNVQDISLKILENFRSMPISSTANFILNVLTNGGILDGGSWFVTIDKTSESFGAILAKKYSSGTTSQGIMIKTCSIYNGQLVNWGVIGSDAVTSATLE